MSTKNNVIPINSRSKKRIKELGEVFTPPETVSKLLDTLDEGDQTYWSTESKTFFEPNCGTGNIVIGILQRMLDSYYKKGIRHNSKNPSEFAVVNTLHNFWAIDIQKDNVVLSRKRAFKFIMEFLLKYNSKVEYIKRRVGLISHLSSMIRWQIFENEMLSALKKNYNDAKKAADETKASKEWFEKNGHKPLDFDKTWVTVYDSDREYHEKVSFAACAHINMLLRGLKSDIKDFEFVEFKDEWL